MVRILGRNLFGGRAAKERRRPQQSPSFPLPRYMSPTPRVKSSAPRNLFVPPNPATLGAAALDATSAVAAVLSKLTQDREIVDAQSFYRWGREQFGQHWRYTDLLTVLWAATSLSRPESYLEIGVLRGRSAAIVGAVAPDCAIYGFDLWVPDYAGGASPDPDFVRSELTEVGHRGNVSLVSGNSQEELPTFLDHHPDLYFDLITIDGDKTESGAAADFANALPRLKVGGIVVSDDVCMLPHVMRVWDTMLKRDNRYVTWEFLDGWLGAAAAIRVSDDPIRASDFGSVVVPIPSGEPIDSP